MAKDNLFLGMARGKVGDVVFSRLNGVQVTRARNRAPRNPQSPAQMVQRIIMSSVGKASSLMSGICDHSFEGFETGQLSQRKFMEVNVGQLRDKVADVLAYPVEEVVKASTAFNFSFKNDYAPVLNQYMMSAGSLPTIDLVPETEGGWRSMIALNLGEILPDAVTYADIVSMLGLLPGDQLTFCQVTHDGQATGHDKDIMNGFRYARVILEPSDGDMTSPFIVGGAINKPNERNSGSFASIIITAVVGDIPAGLRFRLKDVDLAANGARAVCGSAVILSRQTGGRWLRSTQFLLPRTTSGSQALNSSTLGLAYETYLLNSASDLYLNQAT